jgi:hypothetical protein
MRHAIPSRWNRAAAVAVLASVLAWPAASRAQLLTNTTETLTSSTTSSTPTLTGQANAVQATVFSLLGGVTTTTLASTGTLSGPTDAREASRNTGNVPSLLTGEVLHATTIGWPDQVASEASLADLSLGVAGTTIGADFVMARALAVAGAAGVGVSSLDNLTINGVPVAVTGAPDQTISIPGGRLVINEQSASASGIVVNALHLIVDGVADVVIGSATAGIR